MPDHSPSDHPLLTKERKGQVKGIDFSRAYHALIKGHVRVQTTRKLKEIERAREEQGEQQ